MKTIYFRLPLEDSVSLNKLIDEITERTGIKLNVSDMCRTMVQRALKAGIDDILNESNARFQITGR